MAIGKTGSPTDGRTYEIVIKPPSGTEITLNCTGDIPTAPGQNDPSTDTQSFQGGDYISVTQDGGYKPSTFTCERKEGLYEQIDQLRADVALCEVTLGGDGFTGTGTVNVSEGPMVVANGKRIETMTVQVTWTSTKTPTGVSA
jgi:hypothetical protein